MVLYFYMRLTAGRLWAFVLSGVCLTAVTDSFKLIIENKNNFGLGSEVFQNLFRRLRGAAPEAWMKG